MSRNLRSSVSSSRRNSVAPKSSPKKDVKALSDANARRRSSQRSPSRSRRDFRSTFGSIERGISQSTDRITYTWNNINAWTPGKSPDDDQTSIQIENTESRETRDSRLSKFMKKSVVSKHILINVSGVVRPGELLAIMGASGAGKTTLLNTLTFRNTTNLKVTGDRCINGVNITSPRILTSVSSFVQQDDMFIGSLTVREHLVFQALVRMHKHIPYTERMARVNEVIEEFGLSKCADTKIGIPGRSKGISGGEMRRLSFASEILTDPPLMFCDEPTSGLDSFMAQSIVSVLKDLTIRGKTIICTIHQPSSHVYAMFDRVLLMAEGRVAYLGDTQHLLNFFDDSGYRCPQNFNPADFFIQTLAIQHGSEESSRVAVNRICDTFEHSHAGKEIHDFLAERTCDAQSAEYLQNEGEMAKHSIYKANWISQFRAVLWRSWISYIKDPLVLKVEIFQTVAVSLVIGACFFGQTFNQDGIQNINGVLFLLLTHFTISNMFRVLDVFCVELPVFLREHFNGMYRTDVYYLSKMLAELPFFLTLPGVFVAIVYFMIGLRADVWSFWETVLILTLVANCAGSMGYLVSCFARSTTVALAIAPAILLPLILLGGFFLHSGSIPIYLSWLKYISWFYYGNEALAIAQWARVDSIDCNRDNITCPPNGKTVLKLLDFHEENFRMDIYALCGLVIFYRILAYLALLLQTLKRK